MASGGGPLIALIKCSSPCEVSRRAPFAAARSRPFASTPITPPLTTLPLHLAFLEIRGGAAGCRAPILSGSRRFELKDYQGLRGAPRSVSRTTGRKRSARSRAATCRCPIIANCGTSVFDCASVSEAYRPGRTTRANYLLMNRKGRGVSRDVGGRTGVKKMRRTGPESSKLASPISSTPHES